MALNRLVASYLPFAAVFPLALSLMTQLRRKEGQNRSSQWDLGVQQLSGNNVDKWGHLEGWRGRGMAPVITTPWHY